MGGRNIIRRIIHNCISCRKASSRAAAQKMADLPSVRVTPARPFSRVGIDYAGPFPFKEMGGKEETVINGYRCPKGAITVVNVYSAHHDPNTYEDPYKFDAARFIAKPGKQKPDMPIMFGVGKRACMGEPFTMIQTFLFLATIVKNFRLSLPDGADGSQNSTMVGTLTLCAHPRTQESKVKN